MGWKNVATIVPGRLFMGNLVSAQSTRALSERRITHIISVCTEPIPAEHPQSGIRHLRIPVQDVEHADLLIWLPHACRFIDDALRSGGVILVHGVYGLSRSATVVAAYLMWSQHMGSAQALDSVRRAAREQIWPNAGFQEQLSIFEMCRYAPSNTEGIYVRWRQQVDRRLQERGHQ
ncbi:phosphatases II [Stereum hirsutum FP-91666 SS1]|uniref:phosphatases II n=1 Tax=Stereum hirsutum (strain FP-91666) TaxID=721885 RepID=UPI0004410218|nr:phosphatases II [Stereum hirsutum FP-91666 SS1]EIM88591.1 phosphatases II [Stereum hirsutum FP-91666 SS1]